MSFMLTTEQIINETKTVTRRNGWKFLKPGDVLMAVEKCQGLKKGEKIKPIKPIRVISTHPELLRGITKEEVIMEGFPDMTTGEFVEMFCKTHKGCTPDNVINRIEFEYIVCLNLQTK